MRRRSAALALAALISLPAAEAALLPEQVAVIANSADLKSRQVSAYYMTARNIPSNNLITLPLPTADTLSEERYETDVAAPIRKALTERHLDAQITCLVTTFGIPLRVDAQQLTPAQHQQILQQEHELANAFNRWQELLARYSKIAPAATQAAATAPATKSARFTLQELMLRWQGESNAALQRVQHLQGEEHHRAMEELRQLQQAIGGHPAMLAMEAADPPEPDAADARHKHLAALQQDFNAARARYALLAENRFTPRNQAEMLELRARYFGLAGEINDRLVQLDILRPDMTEGSLDSELMLLWLNHHPKAHWLANPQCIDPDPKTPPLLAPNTRVMLVARLDGLTANHATAMIDRTLKTEQAGLNGVVYLDSRGLKSNDGYAAFDQKLRDAAAYLRSHTDLKVVLEETPSLLKAADCPDAALYCGWYSLRNYQESCQWLPGSVGYHVASHELATLHRAEEKGWCLNMLNRGVSGTLGATDEPFLTSFPDPRLFFALLVSGQFTQGEVYLRTCPYLSWRIAFVGDPLYNPFAAKPRLTVEQLKADPILRRALPPEITPTAVPGISP